MIKNARYFVLSYLVVYSIRFEVLKLIPFIRVGSGLTVVLAHTTGHSEKSLFHLLRTGADIHKCFKISTKTYIAFLRAQAMTLRMRSKSEKRKSVRTRKSIEAKTTFRRKRIIITTQ